MPEYGVACARPRLEHRCDGRENGVACAVPESVVDALEVIQVEEQQAKLVCTASGAGDLAWKIFAEMAAIMQTRQRVGDGVVLQILKSVAQTRVAFVQRLRHIIEGGADLAQLVFARTHARAGGEIPALDLCCSAKQFADVAQEKALHTIAGHDEQKEQAEAD